MKILLKIYDFIKSVFVTKIDGAFSLQKQENVDTRKLKKNIIYIESSHENDRWLHMMCPCGCGDVISVNLMKSISPSWGLIYNEDSTFTLSPSIDKTTGCKSHFFIRNSKIQWA